MFRDIENLLDTWLEMIEAQSPRTLSKPFTPKKSWPGSIEQDDECVFITIEIKITDFFRPKLMGI